MSALQGSLRAATADPAPRISFCRGLVGIWAGYRGEEGVLCRVVHVDSVLLLLTLVILIVLFTSACTIRISS